MQIIPYYSIGGSKSEIELLMEEGVKSVLISYAYMSKGLPEFLVDLVKKGKLTHVMVDSGAFTNYSKPGTVTLPDYMKFLEDWAPEVTEYAVLDNLRSRSATLATYEKMVEAGLDPMLIDHIYFPWSDKLSPYYATGKKLGWGGMVIGGAGSRVPRAKLAASVEKRAGFAREGKKTPIHLYGVGQRAWRFLPYFDVVTSLDSTAWVRGPSGFGAIMHYTSAEEAGEFPRMRSTHHKAEYSPELKEKIRKEKLDMSFWKDRIRFAIREFQRYYPALEKFYAKNAGKNEEEWTSLIKRMDADFEAPYVPPPLSLYFSNLPDSAVWPGQVLAKREPEVQVDLLPVDLTAITDFPSVAKAFTSARETGEVAASEDEWAQLLASGLVKVSLSESLQKRGGKTGSVEVPILKSDEMKRLVYGPALIPSVFEADGTIVEGEADAQGDVVTAENIEAAAHDYLERYNESSRTGFMHTAFNKDIRVVESYILPVEMKFGSRTLPKGTWMIVMRVLDDAVWAKVLSKEITGFSIGGVAKEYRLFGEEGEKDE